MKVLFCAIATVLFCLSFKAQSIPIATSDSLIYKGVLDSRCQLEITFASIGSGIDGPCYEAVEQVLMRWKLVYTAKSFGREGETRLCIAQLPRSKKSKNLVINQLKIILQKGHWASMNLK